MKDYWWFYLWKKRDARYSRCASLRPMKWQIATRLVSCGVAAGITRRHSLRRRTALYTNLGVSAVFAATSYSYEVCSGDAAHPGSPRGTLAALRLLDQRRGSLEAGATISCPKESCEGCIVRLEGTLLVNFPYCSRDCRGRAGEGECEGYGQRRSWVVKPGTERGMDVIANATTKPASAGTGKKTCFRTNHARVSSYEDMVRRGW